MTKDEWVRESNRRFQAETGETAAQAQEAVLKHFEATAYMNYQEAIAHNDRDKTAAEGFALLAGVCRELAAFDTVNDPEALFNNAVAHGKTAVTLTRMWRTDPKGFERMAHPVGEVKTFKRIGWLDSTGQPSHIHITPDDGQTTLCGHVLRPCPGWKIQKVPESKQGRSAYCAGCWKLGQSHSLPWI